MARLAHADDFALTRVRPDAQKPWFGIAIQRFGQVSALSQFLLGATLGYSMTFGEAFLALLLGSIILEVIMCIVGIIGQKEGLNTALLARWTGFGEIGASLVGLAIGISLIGWFGIQSAISAESLDSLLPGVMPVWAWSLIFGLAVTAIVALGFKGMQWLANVTVPLFLILVGWSIISELGRHAPSKRHGRASPAVGGATAESLLRGRRLRLCRCRGHSRTMCGFVGLWVASWARAVRKSVTASPRRSDVAA